jgi:O-antigen/teichoic acid export membrane protein
MTNLVLAYQAEKMYPYLKCDRKSLPSKETRKSIYKNAGAMSIHKLGDVMLNNTDSLIMSSFVGVGSVGIYSNYLLISNSVNTALSSILGATTASIGNLSATEDRESVFRVYKVLQFLCFWIYSFSCVAFMILYNPFISAWTAWTGKDYLFPMTIVFVYVLNFYINGMRKGILIFRDAMGLYWYDRYKPIFEVIINLVFSIVLVIKMGIVGIMFGTFISVMSTCFWVEPLVTYKYGFHKKVSHYFILFAKYTAVMFIAGGFTYWVCSFFDMGGYKEVLIKGILCTLLYNVILLLLYFRTDEFREIWKIMKNLMHNYREKKGRA